MSKRIDELMETVRTRRIIGKVESGDMEGYEIDNIVERLDAADELARAKATKALSVLQDFFVENFLDRYNIFHGGEILIRLGKDVLLLGGEAAFDEMMITRILPSLKGAVAFQEVPGKDRNRGYTPDEFDRNQKNKILTFFTREFGSVGTWEGGADRKRREAEAAAAAAKKVYTDGVAKEIMHKNEAERVRRNAIRVECKKQHRCVFCGRPLTILDRLQGREKHARCKFPLR